MMKVEKKGISVHIKHGHPDQGYDIKEILIGHRSFVALLGFIVGAHLVGRSLWEYATANIGMLLTAILGVFIFLTAGVILHEFRDVREVERRERQRHKNDETKI